MVQGNKVSIINIFVIMKTFSQYFLHAMLISFHSQDIFYVIDSIEMFDINTLLWLPVVFLFVRVVVYLYLSGVPKDEL